MATAVQVIDVMVSMRDGVRLATTLAVPNGAGPFPAVLKRVPYIHEWESIREGRDEWLVAAGYAVVGQLLRGRGPSEGEFVTFGPPSIEDGADTIAWIAAQEWCDGNVSMYGGSYGGLTQYEAAIARPPALRAIVPASLPLVGHNQMPWQWGKFRPHWVAWHGHDAPRGPKPAWEEVERAIRTRPLRDAPAVLGQELPEWWEWIRHPTGDEFWCDKVHFQEMCETEIPALHLTGWYDDGKKGILAYFERKTQGPYPERQWLVVGPWGHEEVQTGTLEHAGLRFPPEVYVDMRGLHLAWYERWLRGCEDAIADWPRARIFVSGRNEWHGFDRWPPPGTEERPLYLHGGGELLEARPAAHAEPAVYVYDPADPVDSDLGSGHRHSGVDLRPILDRDDVLVFQTPPLDQELVLAGRIRAELWFASTVGDTDVICHSAIVQRDGLVRRLDTIPLRLPFRNGWDAEPSPIEPNVPIQLELQAPPTCLALQPGERLMFLVMSSWWPYYDINPNTGRMPLDDDGSTVVAVQTLFLDAKRPSRLRVPVASLGGETRLHTNTPQTPVDPPTCPYCGSPPHPGGMAGCPKLREMDHRAPTNPP